MAVIVLLAVGGIVVNARLYVHLAALFNVVVHVKVHVVAHVRVAIPYAKIPAKAHVFRLAQIIAILTAKTAVLVHAKIPAKAHVWVSALAHVSEPVIAVPMYALIHVLCHALVRVLDARHAMDAQDPVLVNVLVAATVNVLVDAEINVPVDAPSHAHRALINVSDALDALVALPSALDARYLVQQAVISHVLPDVRRHVKQDVMVVLPNALARVLSLVKNSA